MTQIVHHSSNTNEHPTPIDVVARARRLMRRIDLDPASCAKFNKQIGAKKYFGIRQDGLRQPWHGRVFLNPPGGLVRKGEDGIWRPVPKNENGRYMGPGDSSMCVWWNRLAGAWQSGKVTEAIFIGFTLEILRTSQASVLPIQHFPRCYPRERMAFGGDQPTHANIIVYLPRVGDGNALKRFHAEFGELGLCEGWGKL